MKPILHCLCIAGIALAACRTTTPVAPTATPSIEPNPTLTPRHTPTRTPIPTATKFPTSTPRPTNTIGPTATITPTPTPFLLPDGSFEVARGAVPVGAMARIGIGDIRAVALSPDEQTVAVGTLSGVYLYAVGDFEEVWNFATARPVHDVEWSPDGAQLAVHVSDNPELNPFNLLIVDPADGFIKIEIGATDFDWSSDGQWLVTNDYLAVAIWDASTWIKDREFQVVDTEQTWSWLAGATFSPDGKLVAIATDKTITCLIDVESGESIHTLEHEFGLHSGHSAVKMFAFSPDGSWLATYTGITGPGDAPGGEGAAFIWNVQTGSLEHRVTSNFGPVTDVQWLPNGDKLVIATPSDIVWGRGRAEVWDVRGERLLHTLSDFDASQVSISPDAKRVIAASERTGNVVLWNIETGKIEHVYVGHIGYVYAGNGECIPSLDPVWFSDGRRFLIASNRALVEWGTDSFVARRAIHARLSNGPIRWSPSGQAIALTGDAASGEPTKAWWVKTSQPYDDVDPDEVIADWYVFKPIVEKQGAGYPPVYDTTYLSFDGRFRVSGSIEFQQDDKGYLEVPIVTVQMRDAQTDHVLFEFAEKNIGLASIAISPDNRFLAIGYGPPGMGIWHPDVWNIDVCFITIWDMQSGGLVHRYHGHTGAVYGLSWSPDSRTLASRSADGTILLWPTAP